MRSVLLRGFAALLMASQAAPAARRRVAFEFRIEPDDPSPAYVQLQRQVRIAAAEGVPQPGERLPSVRATAAELDRATNTVARAYAELAREGVLVTRPGGGSSIAPRHALDRPALVRQRQERLSVLRSRTPGASS